MGTTTTPRLGLVLPDDNDAFGQDRFNAAFTAVDSAVKTVGAIAVAAFTPPNYGLGRAPVDGDMVSLIVDASNGIEWLLRYAASEPTNKWRYQGGPPLSAEVLADEQPTAIGWGDLPTVGPSVVIPRPGDYIAEATFSTYGGAGAATYCAVAVARGANAITSNDGMRAAKQTVAAGEVGGGAGEGFRLTPRAALANETWRLVYDNENVNRILYSRRRLHVTPVRIA